MSRKESQRPWMLAKNRVERFFVGGQELDRWQRLEGADAFGDSTFSEELLVNTHPYIGPGTPPHGGLSVVEGAGKTLRELIEAEPAGFLGTGIRDAYGAECPALCKAGDSTGRLILQYHPTRAFAQAHLACAFGKAEAWYMLGARSGEPHCCYVGFKPGVTREAFEEMVAREDVAGMLACIHQVPFELGDVILVPAGTIHAMGPDTTFIEVHEPCDYTMRFERDNYGRRMEDDDLHYGLGFQALFDGLDFTTYTAEEIRQKARFRPVMEQSAPGWTRWMLLPSGGACPAFSMERLSLHGRYTLPGDGAYQLLVALRGDTALPGFTLPQGRAAFVPAAVASLALEGRDAELLLVRPGRPGEEATA